MKFPTLTCPLLHCFPLFNRSTTENFQVDVKKAIGADVIVYNAQTHKFVGLVSAQPTTGATTQERAPLQSDKRDEKLVVATRPKPVSKEVVKVSKTGYVSDLEPHLKLA